MRILCFLLALLSAKIAVACECKSGSLKERQVANFKVSQLIAVVDVFDYDIDSGVVKAVILEELKGDFASDTLMFINSEYCGLHMTTGRWLVYLSDDEFVEQEAMPTVDGCSISRSFANPHHIIVSNYRYPPPTSPKAEPNQSPNAKWENDLLEKAKRDLMSEIRVLRSRL